MQASAWNDGANTYGIRVGIPNRDAYFQRGWSEIEVEMDGRLHRFRLTPGFWHKCPEFRDRGTPVIREWLWRHYTLPWPRGKPHPVQLIPLDGCRFRLLPCLESSGGAGPNTP
jgi:hypothetical protein